MKKIIALIVALAMLFALTGCIRTQSTLKFNKDGTCDIKYLIAVMPDMFTDPETDETIELFDEETFELLKELGFDYEEYSEDDYEGYVISQKVDLNTLADEESVSAAEAIVQSPVFYIEKDKVILDYQMQTDDGSMATVAEMLASLGGYETLSVEFPFKPVETNATTVSEDGKQLTWDILEVAHAYAVYSLDDFKKAGIPTDYMTVNPFDDIEYGPYYHDAVLWAYENGITTGTSATKFSPSATCTRGQVVTFLWRAMGEPEPETTVNPFTDVKESDYFCKAVLWAVENGITAGTSATKFSPSATCTFGHILTFIWRTLGEPGKTGEGEWYSDALNWAESDGLLSGMYTGPLSPSANCPRADVVTFLYRALNVSYTDYISEALEEQLLGSYL